MTLKPGDVAPEFTLVDQDRNPVSLSDYRGKNVVLTFYVLAFTGGCTNELIAFRNLHDEFVENNAEVLGISIDTFPTLKAFSHSIDLNFPLLSDFPSNKACKAYGTYEPEAGTSKRVTFVVDGDGIIRQSIISDEDMTHHAMESLRAVKELQAVAAPAAES